MTALASSGLMLLTTKNWWVNLPEALSSGKYFWLAFMVKMRHSCGTSRNCFSNSQTSTLGRSTKAVTSCTSGLSSKAVSSSASLKA